MGSDERGSSGGGVIAVVALVVGLFVAVPCCLIIGVPFVGGLLIYFSARHDMQQAVEAERRALEAELNQQKAAQVEMEAEFDRQRAESNFGIPLDSAPETGKALPEVPTPEAPSTDASEPTKPEP